jgi:hypothetical protein
MAVEGQEQVVDQPGVDSPTTESQKPAGEQQEGKKPANASPNPGANGDYEKRIAGITADLQKERKARQQYEKDLATERAALEAERKRVQALAGLAPKSEQQEEEEAIKARLEALGYPRLTKEDLEALREMRATQQNLTATTQHHWMQHGRQMVGGVVAEIEKELGGKLTDRQAKRIAAEYTREAEASELDENGDPVRGSFLWRHEQGDKTLITEFAKQLSEDWFEPVRRKVTQQEAQRYRPVPSGKDRGLVTHGEKKIDVNDAKAVEDFLVKSYREKNGEFKGRR